MKKFILLSTCALSMSLFAGGHVVAPNPQFYQKECGSCHTAYQPEFLPSKSWNKLMDGQNLHFGEDLSLSKDESQNIRKYLLSRSADVSNTKTATRFVNNDTIKISSAQYFIKEHRKITNEKLAAKGLKSFANCTVCHKQADAGMYDD